MRKYQLSAVTKEKERNNLEGKAAPLGLCIRNYLE